MSLKQQDPKPELIEEYKTFHLAHAYDMKNKVWKFVGYTCTQCGRTVQNPNIVPKHYQNCNYKGPTIYLQEPDPSQFKTISGQPWKPFDVQIHKITKHGEK
jgi:hypothetical protein